MFNKMKEIYELQKKAREIQKKLESVFVEQTDSGVKLKMNGLLKVESLEIDPALLSTDKKEKLEGTLCRLFTQSAQEVQKRSALESKDLLQGLSL
ncbi:MAG: YbaB/EbfC family nucleoid-associated protein [Elusimicrobia bacterium]|nr:YbaB/EbfC family nucleoid-associated protein [Elusimicrobiota bacterium]